MKSACASEQWALGRMARAHTGARVPRARIFDVHFTRGVDVAKEHHGNSRDGVFLVVDVCEVGVVVNVVSEVLVSDLRQIQCSQSGQFE